MGGLPSPLDGTRHLSCMSDSKSQSWWESRSILGRENFTLSIPTPSKDRLLDATPHVPCQGKLYKWKISVETAYFMTHPGGRSWSRRTRRERRQSVTSVDSSQSTAFTYKGNLNDPSDLGIR